MLRGPVTRRIHGQRGTVPRRTVIGPSVEFRGEFRDRFDEILTPEATEFLVSLDDRFEDQRRDVLRRRGKFRQEIRSGRTPAPPKETEKVRRQEWTVPPPPRDLLDRRVEITGPVDRKMIINALNSGAKVYMADFEDAHAPTWVGTMQGQVNLYDAVRRVIEFRAPEGRTYRLNESTATLMVRPRGWHLDERHMQIRGHPISASLFDFGLFFFHNAEELVGRRTAPYFYLPKIEHYLEAELWNDVFVRSEERLGLPPGTIRATALIETLPAAFQMDEILWKLREHSVGLNCGRWDYLFSYIKQYRDRPTVVFPDRARLTMGTPFLTAYSRLLIETCHRRGAHAMGGMAAQIPIKNDATANAAALANVAEDKFREVRAGHDGTWVAHPGLVPVALAVFDAEMPTPNQIDKRLPARRTPLEDLLDLPSGPVTEEGVRRNCRAAFRYLESWLRGIGCVPIDNLMEDAATAEIARAQLWQWVHHGALLADRRPVDPSLIRDALRRESEELRSERGGTASVASAERAFSILDRLVNSSRLEEFMTQYAYSELPDAPEEAVR